MGDRVVISWFTSKPFCSMSSLTFQIFSSIILFILHLIQQYYLYIFKEIYLINIPVFYCPYNTLFAINNTVIDLCHFDLMLGRVLSCSLFFWSPALWCCCCLIFVQKVVSSPLMPALWRTLAFSAYFDFTMILNSIHFGLSYWIFRKIE